jgi:hypothetical protein
MNKNNNETTLVIKPVYQRHVSIDENIHSTLSIHSLSLYMVLRYQADFSKEDAEVKRSAQFLYTRAKIKKSQYYLSMTELEQNGLVLRDPENKLGEKCVIHVARELGYFTRGVHTVDRGVHDMDTDQYSPSSINNSEFNNSPVLATKEKPKKPKADVVFLMALINVYREVFPDNPQPHKRVIATSLQRTLLTLVKRWPELDPDGNALTVEAFERYLTLLKTTAPKFSLGEYVTDQGNRKKNTLETFARWNTVVKFLENAYS